MTSTLSLLSKSRFLPLFATQMLGAINDNLFKNALVVLALYRLSSAGPIVVALAGGVFVLPYALFSALAGQLADGNEKSRLILYTKFWELGIMLLATAGFLTGSVVMLMLVLFGLGVQATFFSPLKYGILPDHLHPDELVAGNGLIEAGTFIGILIGTIAGGALMVLHAGPQIVSLAGVIIAVAGILTARFVPPAFPAEPRQVKLGWNIVKQTGILLGEAKANRPVWLSLLGISWFWAVGATLLAEFPTIARVNLQARRACGDTDAGSLFNRCWPGLGFLRAAVAGQRIGAAIALGVDRHFDFYSGFRVCSNVPVSALHNVTDMLGDWEGRRMLLDLLLLSACGGCYSVPLYAICQERSAASHRSRMIAANNVLNALAMTAAAILTAGIYAIWPSAPGILLAYRFAKSCGYGMDFSHSAGFSQSVSRSAALAAPY